jgi:Family of unknown function (DUF5684)
MGNEQQVAVNPMILLTIFGAIGLIVLAIVVSHWKIFTKAGQPGWASLVPLYNIVVMLQVTGKPVWYIALLFIPLANLYVVLGLAFWLSRCFGKSSGFALGMIFLPFIFYPVLAFDDSTYQGPVA